MIPEPIHNLSQLGFDYFKDMFKELINNQSSHQVYHLVQIIPHQIIEILDDDILMITIVGDINWSINRITFDLIFSKYADIVTPIYVKTEDNAQLVLKDGTIIQCFINYISLEIKPQGLIKTSQLYDNLDWVLENLNNLALNILPEQ